MRATLRMRWQARALSPSRSTACRRMPSPRIIHQAVFLDVSRPHERIGVEQLPSGFGFQHIDLYGDAKACIILAVRGDQRAAVSAGSTPARDALLLVKARRQVVHDPQIRLACGELPAEVSSDLPEIHAGGQDIVQKRKVLDLALR